MAERKLKKGSSITRVLQIVEAVSNSQSPVSPAELSLMLNIPRPSVHRLIQQLVDEGYLELNLSNLLVVGQRLNDVASGVFYSRRYKSVRQAILKKLSFETGETCGISIPDGSEMIYYDRVQTERRLQINLPVGSRVPVWCSASGKLYLSQLPENQRNRLIRSLPFEKLAKNTIIDPDVLEQEVSIIGENLFSTDNEEYIDGTVACAVPLIDQHGRYYASLFVHAPLIRKSLDELAVYETELRQASLELSELHSLKTR